MRSVKLNNDNQTNQSKGNPMTTAALNRPASPLRALASLDAQILMTILLAGGLATVAFDMFGQAIAPLLGFAKLAPAPLAGSVVTVIVGEPIRHAGSLVHFMTGLLAYPLGWFLIAKPIADRVAPSLPWPVTAIAYGIGLFIFALYFMAHLVAGNPPFLGWGGITWVALVGHVIFAVVAAYVIETRRKV